LVFRTLSGILVCRSCLLYSVSVGGVAGDPDVGIRLVAGPLHQTPRVHNLLPVDSLHRVNFHVYKWVNNRP
jgi:hypothetical protein